jgi:hypothetical protein
MKILFGLIISVCALFLGACASDRPLVADEQYDAQHPAASHSPDYSGTLPQPSNKPPGF